LKIIITFLFLFISSILFSQEISGKIYDGKMVVGDIKITNLSTKKVTYSDDEGDFIIQAQPNDSIRFYSLFYKTHVLKIEEFHFDEKFVVELKEITNELDEIVLNQVREKEFNEEGYTNDFNKVLQNDIKNNPHLYQPATNGDADILAIVGLIAKLFKGKKSKKEAITTIDYEGYKTLFSTSDFFNNQFLNENLNITDEQKFLFFGFCSEKGIDSKLLLEKNQFLFIEELVKSSHEFLAILEKNKND